MDVVGAAGGNVDLVVAGSLDSLVQGSCLVHRLYYDDTVVAYELEAPG